MPAAAIVVLAVACGSGRVDPISRSSLPQTVPPVAPSAMLEALPEPADFGPGWRFDTDELGADDYFVEYSRSRLARECPGADPVAAGIPVESPEATSGVLRLDGQDGSVSVKVAVDSPARAADRLALMRASFAGCDRLEFEWEGRTATEDWEPLDPPEAGGDESVAVRVRIVGQNEPGEEFVATFAYARAGGLVVGLGGNYGIDPVARLPAALAEARAALGI